MAAADYRLLTEATGQRIAAALEALSGTGAAAAAARTNLDVYSKGETDDAIAQSTATGGENYFQSPDGTQICYLNIRDFTFQPNTTTTKEYTFPKPFLWGPAIAMSVHTTITDKLIVSPYGISATGFTMEGVSTFSVAQNPLVTVIAIGKWK